MWGKEKVKENIEIVEGMLLRDGESYDIKVRDYLKRDDETIRRTKPKSTWLSKSLNTQNGTKELKEILETNENIIDYPKPLELINKLLSLIEDDSIVLDFFSGSGTTAQAVIEFNKKNEKKTKFILVQLPEKTGRNDYLTIADIGKERIRRTIKKVKEEFSKDVNETPLFPKENHKNDLGFKVFEYTRSNYKQWKPVEEETINEVATLFDDLSNPLIEGWKKESLISEILLLEGFPLTSKLTYLDEIPQNEVYRVSAPGFCEHDLYICLDADIHPGTIESLQFEKDDILICLDSALTDELKARLQDQFNVHVI